MKKPDLVVVGSGFFGATIAERGANDLGLSVLILEKRDHVGGNSYSAVDSGTGIEAHVYGTHIFHTSSEKVWNYVNRFSKFNDYRHRVITRHNNRAYTMPINLGTICHFFEQFLSPNEARALVAAQANEVTTPEPANLEEKAISLIGRPLYEAFVRGYTMKQWQTDPRQLPAEIITRLPVRFTFDDFYFSDRYQGIPIEGYTGIFSKMLDSENIKIHTGVDFFNIRSDLPADCPVIFTGPVDRFFEYTKGHLGWRTLDFDRELIDVADFQGAAVVNYPDEDVPFTRIHEFRHLHPERRYQSTSTLVYKEYSRFCESCDEPYYPINTAKDKDMYEFYRREAEAEPRVIFGGRLGTYRYLDMHQAIGAALKTYEAEVAPHFTQQRPLKHVPASGVLQQR